MALGLAMATLATCTSCAAAFTPKRIAHDPALSEAERAATVAIHAMCAGEEGIKAGKGSGVITGEHTILTANHVVACGGISVLFIETLDGNLIEAKVVAQAEEHDIAKLETLEKLPKVKPFGWATPPKKGAVICAESAVPMRSRKCGNVLHKDKRPGADLEHNAITIPGNSGSGVFDTRGRLVGIVTMSRSRHGRYVGGLISTLWDHRKVMRPGY